jgi:hypothetical protein
MIREWPPRLAAGLACATLLTACGGHSASSYSGTAKLAHALNANGVACTSFTARTAGSHATEGAAAPVKKGAKPLPQQAGACSHGSNKLLLFTFRTPALRDRWLELGKLYGSVVVGPNWTVTSPNKALADQISGAIGGNVR